jgi:putative ABC transport system permease protein
MTVVGVAIGIGALGITLFALGPWLQATFGLTLRPEEPTSMQWMLLAGLLIAGWLASLLPGWRAYRLALADGLSPRI